MVASPMAMADTVPGNACRIDARELNGDCADFLVSAYCTYIKPHYFAILENV